MLRKINLLSAVIAVFFTVNLVSAQKTTETKNISGMVSAQKIGEARSEEMSLEEAQRRGLLPKGFPLERYEKIPDGCPKNAKAYVIIRNATTGLFPTAMLMSKLNTNPYLATLPLRKYGDKGPDRWFGDSFALGSCKVCAAAISAEVANEGGENDGFHVWLSPDGAPSADKYKTTLKSAVSYMGNPPTNPQLWAAGDPVGAVKVVTMDLPANLINQYIFATANPFLDAVVWDDTRVDSMQLVIWR
ncbi:MAG TPA: hypothetical protein VGC76_17140 [Pyrinomonadaceae bacterium]|jgi:hypothetical protein